MPDGIQVPRTQTYMRQTLGREKRKVILTLRMKKLRHTKVRYWNQGYTSRKAWEHLIQSQGSKALRYKDLTHEEQGFFRY